jgi:pyruvate/2-oxoglutarate dehydrogenase complex dihydrolipoamide dehydrogenase (E3) component
LKGDRLSIQLLPGDSHDARLLANVHPPAWVNPVPAGRYNLVVIGAGTAGLVAAAGAAGLGARVAIIERELMGGDCLNAGCVPSKALIRAARAAGHVRDADRFGIEVPGGVRVDFARVMERLRRLRAEISPHDSAARFRDLGVDVFIGEGRFSGPDTITVAGQTLRFRRAVIATGSRPKVPALPGLADGGFLTNETVFALTDLPRRLAVIGAGPVGCELAQAFARLGSQVFLIGKAAQLLPREDSAAAARLEQAFRQDGIELLLGTAVAQVENRAEGKVIRLEPDREVIVDEILVAVGRAPRTDGLNLQAAGVAYCERGITVNDRLQTTNRRIFAAGDVCSAYKFTHAADAMARIVLQNALFFGRAKAGALTIPWCTFTDPEIAHVGLSEREAMAKNIPVQVFVQELGQVDRAVLDGETEGFAKVLVRPGTDKILGATIVAAHAGEMIAEISLAMTARLGLGTLARTIHPYPTQAEALKKIADAYNRTRLTGTVAWLLRKWLSWMR